MTPAASMRELHKLERYTPPPWLPSSIKVCSFFFFPLLDVDLNSKLYAPEGVNGQCIACCSVHTGVSGLMHARVQQREQPALLRGGRPNA